MSDEDEGAGAQRRRPVVPQVTDTERRFLRLESSFSNLQRDLQRIGSDVQRLTSGVTVTPDAATDLGERQKDQPWVCGKCDRLLGYYDRETDVLRLKSKTETTYVCLGEHGWIERICWGCSESNHLGWVPESPG